MRKIIACLALAGIMLAGCDRQDENLSAGSNPPSAPKNSAAMARSLDQAVSQRTIVAFGDSLTAGLGVTPEQAYPAVLERRLEKMGYPCRVVNAGVSGETTAGGLRRVEWILRANPEIVILELGANDGLRGHDLEESKGNLDRIIRRLKAEGVSVILAGMKVPPNYGPQYTSKFSNLFVDLSQQHDLPLIPFFLQGVAARPRLNQPDGLHPTAEGYERVVDNILPILLPVLESRTAARP